MQRDIIKVGSVWEQHSIVAQRRCSCGGSYADLEWGLHVEDDRALERFDGECQNCGTRATLWFDITDILKRGSAHPDMDAFGKSWPTPMEAGLPYIVKRRECDRDMRDLIQQVDAGVVDIKEAEGSALDITRRTHPLIDGKYRVFGYREGSMGVAYLCINERNMRPVVCKLLHPLNADQVAMAALRREAEIWLASGFHPNTVQLLEVIARTPDDLVLVLDWVPPGPSGMTTLREWLDRGAVSLPLALRFAQHLCSAMLHLQEKAPGFVHGDLKPENLLVGIGYVLKVSDFGLARAEGLPGPSLSGRSLGTPLYLAPECWEGRPPHPASDIYAAGLVLYEMLAGKHPFRRARDDEGQLRRFHASLSLPPVPEPVPGWLSDIVIRCTAKRPEDRPSSFAELAAALGLEPSTAAAPAPGNTAADWNKRGTSLDALGRYGEAIECYMQALALEPSAVVGWVNLGVALAKSGHDAQAESVYQQALSFDSVPPEAHANYAALLLRSKRFEEALSQCDKALAKDSHCFPALLSRAAVLNSIGRYEEAREAAEGAAKRDRKNARVWVELGTACFKLGRISKATDCAKRALRADSNFEPARTLARFVGLPYGVVRS